MKTRVTYNTYLSVAEGLDNLRLESFAISKDLRDKDPTTYLGRFGQLICGDDNVIRCGVSNGKSPIGIIEAVEYSSTSMEVLVRIYRSILNTTRFSWDAEYKTNNNLFVNHEGDITTFQPSPYNPCVGTVIQGPNVDCHKYITMMLL